MKKETFENFVEVADARLYGTSKRRTIFFKAMTSVLALNMLTLGMTPVAYGSVLGSLADVDGKVAAGTYTGLDAGTFLDAADDITVGTAATDKSVFQTSGKWEITGGKLTAPGNIFLLAGGGLTFSGGTIDVGGLVAAAMNGFEFDATYKPGDVSGDVTVSGTSINAGYKVFIGQNVTGADGTILETRGITAKDTGDVTFSVAENGATITFVNAKITEGNIKADTVDFGDGGEVSANINADTIKLNTGKELTQSGGTIDTSKIEGAVTQSGGNLGKSGATIEITGKLTQTAGAQVDADTLTVAGGSSVAGTVNAGTITITGAEALAASGAINAGEIQGAITQSGGEIKGANGTGDVKIGGALTQTAGAIDASTLTLGADSEVAGTVNANTVGAGTTTLKVSGSADVNVTETLTAGTLDVDGGAVDAKNITAKVDQDGGAITVTETIKGDVEVDGATSTLKAAKVDGKLTQDNGTVGEAGKALEVTGALTQNGGAINASTLTLDADSEVAGKVIATGLNAGATTLTVKDGADVDVTETLTASTLDVDGGAVDAKNITAKVDQDGGTITVTETITGDVNVNGDSTLKADKVAGNLTQDNGTINAGEITGAVTQNGGEINGTGDVKIDGALTQNGGTIDADTLTLGADSEVAGTVKAGTVAADGKTLTVKTGADVDVTETLTAGTLDVDGGAVDAKNITAKVDQDGGTITVTETITGDVNVNGDSTLKAKKVDGALTQTAGTVGDASEALEVTGALTQNGGTINADTLTLKGGATQTAGKIDANTLAFDSEAADVSLTSDQNDFDTIEGNAKNVKLVDANDVTLGNIIGTEGVSVKANKVTVDGSTVQAGQYTEANGTYIANGNPAALNIEATEAATIENGANVVASGAATVTGGDITVDNANLAAIDGVTVEGKKVTVQNKGYVASHGDVTVTGSDAVTVTGEGTKVASDKGTALNGGAITVENKGAVYGKTGITVGKDVAVKSFKVDNGLVQAGQYKVTDGKYEANGTAADLTVNAEAATIKDANVVASGKAEVKGGDITVDNANLAAIDGVTVEGKKVTVQNKGYVASHGDVTVKGSESVTVTGEGTKVASDKATSLNGGEIIVKDGAVYGKTAIKVDASQVFAVDNGLVQAGQFELKDGKYQPVGNQAELFVKAEGFKAYGGAQVVASGKIDVVAADTVVDNATLASIGGTKVKSDYVNLYKDAQVVSHGNVEVIGQQAVTVTGAKVGSDANTKIEGASITADADSEILAKDTLDLNATAGDIAVAGKVISKNAALKATGDITLANAANDFRGAVAADGKNVKLVDANAIELGEVTATGNLDVTAEGGAITQSAAADVEGTTTLVANGNNITLDNAANDFTGAVTADGNNVKLVDADAIELGEVKADGYFVAQALDGNIDVTDTVTAKNTLLDAAKGDITVDATVDGENVTLNAGKDVVENAAVNATADKVVVAGNNIKANSSFDANNAVYKAGNEVDFNGAANVAGVLGVEAKNDITVDGNNIKADTLVLRSTDGDVDVKISSNTKKLAVQADNGVAKVEAEDITVISGASAVTKRVNADGVASDDESVAANGITGTEGVTANIDGNLNASSIKGGDVALNVNGNADVGSISGGDIDLDVAGNAGIDSIDGANIDANIADNAELSSIDGDNVNLVIGSDLAIDEMSAGDVLAEVGGNFAIGQVTADNVEMLVNGDLEDNDSLVEVDNLIADVGGDIGSVNDPINIKAKKIESVKGRNVNLNDKTVAGTVELGSIKASGNLNLTANDIGSAAGNAGGYVNANGLAGNLEAGGSINLNVGGFFGEADNPMVVTFGDKLSVGGGNMVENPDILIHAIYNGTVGGTVIYPHNYGFVIANGQFIAGNVEKIRAINRALAFTVNTPELKSTQGVFGEPSFIHLNMSVSDATSMGVVDTLTLNNINYFKTFDGLYRDEAIENWVPAIDILDQQLSDKLDGFKINEDASTQPDIMDLTMNR